MQYTQKDASACFYTSNQPRSRHQTLKPFIDLQPSEIQHLPSKAARKTTPIDSFNSIDAGSNHKSPTDLHRLPRPSPRSTPTHRHPRPLPRLLPTPLYPRNLQPIFLPSLLGRPPSLRNPLRPSPWPGLARRIQRKSNRVHLSAARTSILLTSKSTTAT